MEDPAKNVIIYRFRFYSKFPKIYRQFTDNFPNITNFSPPLSIVSLHLFKILCFNFDRKGIQMVWTVYTEMYGWSTFHNPEMRLEHFAYKHAVKQ